MTKDPKEAPLSGPCIECHQETEDRHGGDWLHDSCAEQLNEEYERDCRLDDPRHGQGGR